MDNHFARVKSIIERLRNVLKCQKCLQFQKEDSMLFYHSCDHFFCIDCVGNDESCRLCNDSSDKPKKVVTDKNILSLYQSLGNFELPSKQNVEVIYKNLKESKEEVEREPIKETPLQRKRKKSFERKNISSNTEDKNEGNAVIKNQVITPVRGRRRGSITPAKSKSTLLSVINKATPVSVVNAKGSNKEVNPAESKTTPVSVGSKKGSIVTLPSMWSKKENNSSVSGGNKKGSTTPLLAISKKENTSPLLEGNKKENATLVESNKEKTITPKSVCTTPVSGGNKKGNTSATKTNINKRNPKGETQLHIACKKLNFSAMKELISAGANPNAQDNAGWTPLHDSVFSGNVEVIKFLLDNGAKVNAPGLENTTALHEAIAKGNLSIVKLLLEYGADVNAMNIFRETPLDLVNKYKLDDLKTILLESSKKVTVKPQIQEEEVQENILIYKHELSVEDEKLVNKFAEKFNLEIVTSVTLKNPPTHVVIPKGKFQVTWAVISSVSAGCWISTVDWVRDSLNDNIIKPSSQYESNEPLFSGFAKSRANKQNQLPGLFSGCHFYFGGNFEHYSLKNLTFSKESLKLLVEKQGGVSLKRCPDPESLALEKTVPFHADPASSLKDTSYFIIYQTEKWDPKPKYNMSHMKTLPIDWLICCLFKFELVDVKNKGNDDFCDFL